jgi:hypothetical protein
VPAAIFVITSRVEEGDPRPNLDDVREGGLARETLDQAVREAGGNGAASAYLNWSELSRMRASGLISLAGHSHSHIDLGQADRQTKLEELRTPRAVLQERTGGECTDHAWPFGFHNRGAERAARLAGYRTAFRVSTRLFGGRGNRPGANPLALRRLAVTSTLDLEKALEFYHQPSTASRLRAVAEFVRYHLGRSAQGRT